jgi:hypothetical protein
MNKLLSALIILLALAPAAWAQDGFTFVALGDMPYNKPEVNYPKFHALIGRINEVGPAFSVHVGDIKSGSSPCTDEEFVHERDFMNSFATGLVYAIGDNEWTDCHRKDAGGYDPLERLATLRRMFFAEAKSLGTKPIEVEREGDAMPEFKTYVENARWMKNEVLFFTANIPGSNNNFEIRDPHAAAEFFARDAANVAWIKDAFAKAAERNARAVIFAIQADPFEGAGPHDLFPTSSGFKTSLGDTFLPLAQAFKKPVLFIHGDTHVLRIDQPFKDAKGNPILNVTRLEVFGDRLMHAVKVTVEPAKRDIFTFQPIYNPTE